MLKSKLATMVLAFVLIISLLPKESKAYMEERFAGDNRYDTASILSQVSWQGGAEQVVLARGDDFADALASTPFAAKINAPILLTKDTHLPDETISEIRRLGADKVWVMGGPNAISESVITRLKNEAHVGVERIAGKNREETSLKVAELLGTSHQEAIVVNKEKFPDAIAIGPYAALKQIPIILTHHSKLTTESKSLLQKAGKTYFIGGEAVLADSLMQEVRNGERIAGENRYVTAVRIADRFFPTSYYPIIATGEDFADGLTGSLLAAKRNQPILLVQQNKVDVSVKRFFYNRDIKEYTVLGGYNAVDQYIYYKIVEGR
ncbi:cell wall-binding repeat-containing protein [Bacillus salacetis]|uniref:cell wall-binding repeat-containing protein n=1 Tax=Bacillus salacetis TaxID=2315464 RepID=UPI003BA03288